MIEEEMLTAMSQGTSAGSFGDCRKAEREAAKFTGKCKVSCGGPMTTKVR